MRYHAGAGTAKTLGVAQVESDQRVVIPDLRVDGIELDSSAEVNRRLGPVPEFGVGVAAAGVSVDVARIERDRLGGVVDSLVVLPKPVVGDAAAVPNFRR